MYKTSAPPICNVESYVGIPIVLLFDYLTQDECPINLTGKTGKVQIRAVRDLESPIIAEASTTAGSILLGYGSIKVALADAAKSLLIPEGVYFGDLLLDEEVGLLDVAFSFILSHNKISTAV